jgi:outer membrane protein TolC
MIRTRAVLPIMLAGLALASPAEPISLAGARKMAEAASGAAAIKALEVEGAKAALKEAIAARGPKIGLTGSASYLANPPEGIVIRQGALGNAPAPGSQYPVAFPEQDYVIIEDTRNSYFKLSLSASLPLFTWGKLGKAIDIARESLEAAMAARTDSLAAAGIDAANAYLAAALARASSASLADMVAALEEVLAADQAAFDAGTITLQDLLESRANLSRARSARIKSDEGLASALAGLAFLSGSPPLAPDDLTDGLDAFLGSEAPPEEESEAVLTERALAASLELAKLKSSARSAALYAGIQKAGGPLRPDLALQATADLSGQHPPLVGNWTDTWDWSLIISLAGQMTVFDSGQAAAKAAQAEAQAAQALRGAAETERGIPLAVRRAVESARAARAALAEKDDALALALEREKNARISRENELLTRKEELGARAARLNAELEAAMARYTLGKALLDLERLCPR